MSARGKRLYASRADEEEVPPAERWYCPQANCRRWIHTKHLRPDLKYQTCPRCRTKICPQCRDIAHTTTGCTRDPGLPGILEMARRHHWQRCYECHAMVEKNVISAVDRFLAAAADKAMKLMPTTLFFADEEENLALFLVAMDHAEMESALEAGRGTTVEAREAMSMAMAMNR
ncbi:IBR domain protein [Penicillium hetheringtonii]|uniref:IBR domain protein n=1 Tax=Penicillium hetheringtonii TaxID=911720 RepID=A0AAD6DGY7_9EURO|nr:IBR domain protein [Penicillium hetheringtonii]